jgi:hypothetical protein
VSRQGGTTPQVLKVNHSRAQNAPSAGEAPIHRCSRGVAWPATLWLKWREEVAVGRRQRAVRF